MTDIITESVKKLEALLEHGGCADAGVLLDVDPDAKNCQFEHGACMTAAFGGRCAEFVTYDPIRARTKISFMFGAPLDTSAVRGAACATINVATGFFCISRVLRACPPSSHTKCLGLFAEEVAGKKIHCIGSIARLEEQCRNNLVPDKSDAEVIIINGEGIIDSGTGNIIENNKAVKRIICIGPSTVGVARLHEFEHWCPYGRACSEKSGQE
ncbi:hypothetical protein [Methanoregula sp.]|jgi:hypothetical protein|uniref:hypothetical protein n=1 Tax=Methanoregula sp. TaxID=2052170 RepID=UPI003C18750C